MASAIRIPKSEMETARPDEVYNLAAQSFVPASWQQPVLTAEFDAIGVTRVLEGIRLVDKNIRFYQASSSEMFGKLREVPQRETTPFQETGSPGCGSVGMQTTTGSSANLLLAPWRLRHESAV